MKMNKYLSQLAFVVSAALAAPIYAASPLVHSGHFVSNQTAPRLVTKVQPTLDSKVEQKFREQITDLNDHVENLETYVQGLQDDYARIQKILTTGQAASAQAEHIKTVVIKSFGENRQLVDTNCNQAYQTAVYIAGELTPTSVGLSDEATKSLAEYVTLLNSDTYNHLTPYAKATVLTEAIIQIITLLPNDNKLKPIILKKTVDAYRPCVEAQMAYQKKQQALQALQDLANQTPEQRDAHIEDIVKRLFPQLMPKSRVHINAIVGTEYGNGIHARIGGELCYDFGNNFGLCTEVGVMHSFNNKQTSTETSNTVVADVGPVGSNYQTTSNFKEDKTTARNAHYVAGARAGFVVSNGKKLKVVLGAGAEVQGGEKSVVLNRSRSTQLQTNRTNLGAAQSINDIVEQKEVYRTIVPNLSLEGCYRTICARARCGYDTQDSSGPLNGFKPGLDLKLYF